MWQKAGPMASRIKEMLSNVELSVSSYDTAWVVMVPAMDSSKLPLFPKCLNWIMENQQPDGSWGLDLNHPLLVKDSLSSTLACVLALQKWNVGQQLVHKGIHFTLSYIYISRFSTRYPFLLYCHFYLFIYLFCI